MTSKKTNDNVADERWKADVENIRSWRQAPEKVGQVRGADAKRLAEIKSNIEAAMDIDRELMALGMPFGVGDLANVRASYPEALDVLIRHLKRPYPAGVEASIVRALAVRYGGPKVFDAVYQHLLQGHERMGQNLLFALGLAISETASKGNADQLVRIALDARFGAARGPIIDRIGALARTQPDLRKALVRILNDPPPYNGNAIHALRIAKDWRHAARAQVLSSSENSFVRDEAGKYLKGLRKSKAP